MSQPGTRTNFYLSFAKKFLKTLRFTLLDSISPVATLPHALVFESWKQREEQSLFTLFWWKPLADLWVKNLENLCLYAGWQYQHSKDYTTWFCHALWSPLNDLTSSLVSQPIKQPWPASCWQAAGKYWGQIWFIFYGCSMCDRHAIIAALSISLMHKKTKKIRRVHCTVQPKYSTF